MDQEIGGEEGMTTAGAGPRMNQLASGIQFECFPVGRRAHCVWEWNLYERNAEYLSALQPNYFGYLASKYGPDLEGDQKQFAAVGIRTAYGQALETFFALACAVIQAPRCVFGWMQLYRQNELEELVRAIGEGRECLAGVRPRPSSWRDFASVCLTHLALEDTEKEAAVKKGYGDLWPLFASDFLEDGAQEEYNNLKHGLRVRPGGFRLAIGREDTPGKPAPAERMVSLGGSEFGSSSFRRVRLREKARHYRMQRVHRNWDPGEVGSRLQLLAMSMENLIGFARILNGEDPTTIKVVWPTPLGAFEHATRGLSGVRSLSMDTIVQEEDVHFFSDEEILRPYSSDAAGHEETS